MQTQFTSKQFDPVKRVYEYVDYTRTDLISRLEAYGKEITDTNTVPVLYIAGQSNAVGVGNVADIHEFASYDWTPVAIPAKVGFTVIADGTVTAYNAAAVSPILQFPDEAEVLQESPVRIYNKPIITGISETGLSPGHTVNGVWEDYDGTNGLSNNANSNGVELSIAYYWATKIYPTVRKQLHIIKFAVSGTSLGAGATTPDNANWTDAPNQLWDVLLNYAHKPAIFDLLAAGKKPSCLGMIWIQGEGDSSPDLSPLYEANLRSLIKDRFRTKLGFPNMKMYIVQHSLYNSALGKGIDSWNRVKIAQASVCEGPNKLNDCFLIRTDGSDGYPPIQKIIGNEIHTTSLGLAQIGAKIINLLHWDGDDYTSSNDFELFCPALNVGENPAVFGIQQDNQNRAILGVSNVLHEDNVYSRALAWFNDTSVTAKTDYADRPNPRFSLKSFENAVDQELIFKLGYRDPTADATLKNSPAVVLRGTPNFSTTNSGYSSGWLVMFTEVVTLYRISATGAATGLTPNQSGNAKTLLTPDIAIGESVYYKIRLVANTITVHVSRSILATDWIEVIDYTDTGNLFPLTGGSTYFDLFFGLLRTTGQKNSTTCFDVIVANKL